jgi:hypothetical protein
VIISDAAAGINVTIPTLASNASITTTVAFVIPGGAPLAPWINIAEASSDTTAIVTDDAITTVRIPSSPTPIIPPVELPVTSPAVCLPGGSGGGTVETVKDTPIGGTVPGTGGTVATPPSNGTVSVDGNGRWIYTPSPGFTGTDSFVVRTQCAEGVSSDYQFVVNVLNREDSSLPKTGGVDQGLLYGNGFLLILLGFTLLRRRGYVDSKGKRNRM